MYCFHKKLKIKKKHLSGFFRWFFGFFWVGFLGGFFYCQPCLGHHLKLGGEGAGAAFLTLLHRGKVVLIFAAAGKVEGSTPSRLLVKSPAGLNPSRGDDSSRIRIISRRREACFIDRRRNFRLGNSRRNDDDGAGNRLLAPSRCLECDPLVAAGGLAVPLGREAVAVAVAAAVQEAVAFAGLLVVVPAGVGAEAGARFHGLFAYGMALGPNAGLISPKFYPVSPIIK